MSLVRTYATLPLEVERGEDVHVFDASGRRYLDLYAGHAVCSTGHCHPRVVKAIQDQAAKLLFYSNVVGSKIRDRAAAALVRNMPGFSALFSSSGAEANEDALKLARKVTGRDEVVAMEGGFHGRTAGAMSVTGNPRMRVGPQVPGVRFIPFGEVPEITAGTAAVLLEPIQSMSGVISASPETLREIRKRCDDAGAFLIYDEVQTGIGRTGEMFYSGTHGVTPDIVTLAKGIGSGFPLAAALVRDAIAEKVEIGDFGHTYGGGPVAMAALEATIEVVEGLLPNVKETGAYLAERLKKFGEVRGRGFLLGLKIDGSAKALLAELLKRGVIVGASGEPDVIRLLPPLTLQKEHVDAFMVELDAALR
jgi:acetylornithine/succinyldiaminopimelate/putrescine aminotransferase